MYPHPLERLQGRPPDQGAQALVQHPVPQLPRKLRVHKRRQSDKRRVAIGVGAGIRRRRRGAGGRGAQWESNSKSTVRRRCCRPRVDGQGPRGRGAAGAGRRRAARPRGPRVPPGAVRVPGRADGLQDGLPGTQCQTQRRQVRLGDALEVLVPYGLVLEARPQRREPGPLEPELGALEARVALGAEGGVGGLDAGGAVGGGGRRDGD